MWFTYIGVGLFGSGVAVFGFAVLVTALSSPRPPPKKLPYVKPSDYPWYPMTGTTAPSGSLAEPQIRAENRRIRKHNEAWAGD